jgi:hypothetical protein
MAVFSISTIHLNNDAMLKARITEHLPSNYYEIGRGQWLVSFSGTARELFTKLFPEIPDPPQPPFPYTGIVIFGVGGYYGIASRDIWEWIATKLGGKLA